MKQSRILSKDLTLTTHKKVGVASVTKMDPFRVEAYLRSICAVLDFDIGELWCARKEAGFVHIKLKVVQNSNSTYFPTEKKPTLKFIQLYTSDTYVDFHSLLIHPVERKQSQGIEDEEEHRFSPIICRLYLVFKSILHSCL